MTRPIATVFCIALASGCSLVLDPVYSPDGGEADADADARDTSFDGEPPDGDAPECCDGRQCGDDLCGAPCGQGCESGQVCTEAGQCVDPTRGSWVTVRSGEFQMGAPDAEIGWHESEAIHTVQLTYDYVIYSTEVTQREFESVTGYRPSGFPDCSTCPVENVSWHEADLSRFVGPNVARSRHTRLSPCCGIKMRQPCPTQTC